MRALLPLRLLAAAASIAAAPGCGGAGVPEGADVLVVGAYTAPREAFQHAVIPAFQKAWKARTGRDVVVRASYLGSGAQARAVIDGFPADVVVLALEGDVDKIAAAGLVEPDWREDTGNGGIVARTLVVIAVRRGNPLGIRDWQDLARPRVEVLTPNPRTSGGAMWNLLAIYGPDGDLDLVRRIFANVIVMDKGARESLVNFEKGIGDAAITYEQEIVVAHLAGRDEEQVTPPSTIAIDIPAAVVDRHVDARGTRAVAEAFVQFLRSPEGQAALASYGFRPATGPLEVPGTRVFAVADLGGWPRIRKELSGPGGAITRVIEEETR